MPAAMPAETRFIPMLHKVVNGGEAHTSVSACRNIV